MEEMTALNNEPRFKLVPVFDKTQTVGDPLPELVENLTGNVAHYEAFMDSLKTVSPLPVEFEPMQRSDSFRSICESMPDILFYSAVRNAGNNQASRHTSFTNAINSVF